MLRLLRAVLGRIARNPLKGTMLLLAISLNAAVLAAVFAVHLSFNEYLAGSMIGDGTRVWIYLFFETDTGGQQLVHFETRWLQSLKQKAGLRYLSPVTPMMWKSVEVGEETFALPSDCLGVYPDYAVMSNLRMAAGSFFTDKEAASGERVAVVSERAAKALWGSTERAIGMTFTPWMYRPDGSGINYRGLSYRIVGVFAEPTAMQRRFFWIPQLLVPYEFPGSQVLEMRAQSNNPSLQLAKRRIISGIRAIYRESHLSYPEHANPPIWQGSQSAHWSNEDAALLGRLKSVSLFFTSLWIFCLLILAFAILSLFSTDTLDRLREAGLARALGSTRARVIGEIAAQSVIILIVSNAVGFGLTLAFIGPLRDAVRPLLGGGGPLEEVMFTAGSIWKALIVSFFASTAAGVLASLYPSWQVTRGRPSEALREL